MILCPRSHRHRPASDAVFFGPTRYTVQCKYSSPCWEFGWVCCLGDPCMHEMWFSPNKKSLIWFLCAWCIVCSQTQFLSCTPSSVNIEWAYIFSSLFKELLKLPHSLSWIKAVLISVLHSSFMTNSWVSKVWRQALEWRENISYNTFTKRRQRCFSASLRHASAVSEDSEYICLWREYSTSRTPSAQHSDSWRQTTYSSQRYGVTTVEHIKSPYLFSSITIIRRNSTTVYLNWAFGSMALGKSITKHLCETWTQICFLRNNFKVYEYLNTKSQHRYQRHLL